MCRWFFALAFTFSSSVALAQLSPGDIAFVGYNADAPDGFSFVALIDIPASEAISFTDHGWTAAGAFRATEGVIEWSDTAPVSAGTVVTVDIGALTASVGTIAVLDAGIDFAIGGDQVIAFQGLASAPTHIAAIQMNGDWDADSSTSNTSALPTGLTDGINAIAIAPEVDNAIYGCDPVSDDVAGLLASLNDPANWTTDDATPFALIDCGFTVITTDVCPDGVATGGELCDTDDTPGADCTDYGFVDPAGLACNGSCDGYVTTGCAAFCTNDVVEPGEVCDGVDLDGEDCTTILGFDNPVGLACSGTCFFDASGCTTTCNGNPEPGEDCDEGPADTADCDGDCTSVSCGDGYCNSVAEDATGCPDDCAPVCGDDTAAGTEVCDGSDLAGADCTDFGYVDLAGLACNGDCDGYVTSGCAAVCTNDVAEPGETCDGTDVGVQDCTDFGYTAGAGLVCNGSCDGFDTSGCATTCDGSLLEPGEPCDGAFLGGFTCVDLGYVDPTGLACNSSCDSFDDSGCTAVCGNGTLEPTEDCDAGGEAVDCDDDCTVVICGDGNCNASASEDLSSCVFDCAPPGYFQIALVAYNADDPDLFTFVALTALPTGLSIRFTDNGWFAAGGFRASEGIIEWTADADVTVGTEITITPGVGASAGTIVGIGNPVSFAAGGDQLFAYLGDETSPEFLFGLQMNGPWDADATSSNESALPPGLTEGVNALALDPEVDNAIYDCGIIEGNAESLGILISEPTNWTTDNDVPFTQPLSCDLTVQAGDVCGDTIPTGAELCDGVDLRGADCVGLGFDAGDLACGSSCDVLDTTLCTYTCGNDSADGTEVCDGADVGAETCVSQGFDEGTLACTVGCDALDITPCAFTCGNDSADGTEVCDGTDIGSETCTSQGFDAGVLGCAVSCAAYDTAACTTVCGNNSADGAEICDGTDLAGADCTDSGYSTAAGLACAVGCDAVESGGCVATCGDSVVEPGEDCDSGAIDTAACDFDCSAVTCGDGNCNPVAGEDPGGCPADCPDVCGDGLVTGAETCDDGDDTDGDGCSAICVVEVGYACDDDEPSVCSEDPDDDGVGNATDNCPTVANTDQADSDNDGVGNACEPPPSRASGPIDEGCDCRSSPGGAALMLFLPLLWLRRRRR